jgi:manganese/zinc/iron transport system permease protein
MVDLPILLTASFVSCCCALLGCYLTQRKMAMVSDAISHAVLPGIVLAFLWTGSRDSITMLIGAGTLGLFTTFLIEFLHKKAKLQADASIGVTFTWLFAIGVILISLFADKVDLDQDCVLYGEIAYVPLDTITLSNGLDIGARALYITGGLLVILIAFIMLCYKELFITTFDPAYATTMGMSLALWHYLLMGAVSLTTVVSFELVGAILVVALLIVPASTAYLLTDHFKTLLVLACAVGILASTLGYYSAMWFDASIAGAIASWCGILFFLAMLFSPKHGLLFKLRHSPTTASSL